MQAIGAQILSVSDEEWLTTPICVNGKAMQTTDENRERGKA